MFDGEGVTLDTATPDDIDKLKMRDIFVDGRGTAMAELKVLATRENNRTMVGCRDFSFPNNVDITDPLTLNVIGTFNRNNSMHVKCLSVLIMLLGPPSPPEIIVEHVSTTELELEWKEPFTWPGYPVHDYAVTQNHLGDTVNSVNTTNRTFTYSISSDEEQEPCQNFTFNVTARSDLGVSYPGSILTGLPIGKHVTFSVTAISQ